MPLPRPLFPDINESLTRWHLSWVRFVLASLLLLRLVDHVDHAAQCLLGGRRLCDVREGIGEPIRAVWLGNFRHLDAVESRPGA